MLLVALETLVSDPDLKVREEAHNGAKDRGEPLPELGEDTVDIREIGLPRRGRDNRLYRNAEERQCKDKDDGPEDGSDGAEHRSPYYTTSRGGC